MSQQPSTRLGAAPFELFRLIPRFWDKAQRANVRFVSPVSGRNVNTQENRVSVSRELSLHLWEGG